MAKRKRRSGLTLVETLLASTILLVACLTICELIAVSLQHQASTELQMQAYQVAENRLQELRVLARESGPGVPFPDPAWSQTARPVGPFMVDTEVTAVNVVSPCAGLVEGGSDRVMSRSLYEVRVWVCWGLQHVQLATLLGEPERAVGRVEVTPLIEGRGRFEATAYDASGVPIPDVFFDWWVEPSGDTPVASSLVNTSAAGNATTVNATAPGMCRVVAACRYEGRELCGNATYTVRQ